MSKALYFSAVLHFLPEIYFRPRSAPPPREKFIKGWILGHARRHFVHPSPNVTWLKSAKFFIPIALESPKFENTQLKSKYIWERGWSVYVLLNLMQFDTITSENYPPLSEKMDRKMCWIIKNSVVLKFGTPVHYGSTKSASWWSREWLAGWGTSSGSASLAF